MDVDEALQSVLSELPWIAGLGEAARGDLARHLEPIAVAGGQMLFAEGEAGDALYILVSGAVGIQRRDSLGRERRVARIFPPETVGEVALISDQPRSATAIVLRDSFLLRLTRYAFEELVGRWPGAMLYVTRLLATRLRQASSAVICPAAPSAFAVLPLTDGIDVAAFTRPLIEGLRPPPGGRVALVEAWPDGADESWFHRLEAAHAATVYAAPRPGGAWPGLCERRADHVLLLARAGEPILGEALPRQPPLPGWRRRDLVVLEGPGTRQVLDPESHLAGLDLALRLPVREGDGQAIARVARLASGRGVGLVLGGGGARGFAHIGVLRALHERGVPVDCVGGTSMGAVVAAACAIGWGVDEITARLHDAFVRDPPLDDYTLPLVALTRGRKVEERLEHHFGGMRIEDLAKPFFCISANLTTAETRVHRQGPLAQALRASVAIPGLLPPALEDGAVLVDGAMMNNVPADVMADLERGPVLAVDVAQDLAFHTHPLGRPAAALRRLLGIPDAMPSLASLLFRAATVSGDAQTALARARATAVLHPPLADIDLRAWYAFDRAAEIGYAHTLAAFESGALSAFEG